MGSVINQKHLSNLTIKTFDTIVKISDPIVKTFKAEAKAFRAEKCPDGSKS